MADVIFVQCNACGGVYRPILGDGLEYYHACPRTRVVQTAVVDQATGRVITPAVVQRIENRRDERVTGQTRDNKPIIVSEGAGVTPITDPRMLAVLLGEEEIA